MRVSAVLLLALALAAPAAAATGTLHGTIHRGPIQPVCRVGTPCTAPARRVVVLFERATKTVRVRTDAAGRYRVVLAAGRWTIALPDRSAGMSIAPRSVRIVAGATRKLDLAIDTGIR